MKNPVNWFEIPVNDMDRAKAFYESVFEIEIGINEMGDTLMGWFPLDQQSSGVTGSLVKGEGYVPSGNGSILYFSVPEIDEVLPRVEKNGGKILTPKTSIGEHGSFSHFEDSEGNRIALHQGE